MMAGIRSTLSLAALLIAASLIPTSLAGPDESTTHPGNPTLARTKRAAAAEALQEVAGISDFRQLTPPEVPDRLNAALAIREACDRLDEQRLTTEDFWAVFEERNWETMDDWLLDQADTLNLLDSLHPSAAFNHRIGYEHTFEESEPPMSGTLLLMRLLLTRGVRAVEMEQDPEAYRDVLRLLAVAASFRDEPSIAAAVFGLEAERRGLWLLRSTLRNARVRPKHDLFEIAETLETARSHSWVEQEVLSRGFFRQRQFEEISGTERYFKEVPEQQMGELRDLLIAWSTEDAVSVLKQVASPRHARGAAPESEETAFGGWGTPQSIASTNVAISGGLDGILLRSDLQELRLGLAQSAIAIELFAISNDGEFPDRLEALVPRYLTDVPADPWTGEALIYQPKEGGYELRARTGRSEVEAAVGVGPALLDWSR